MASPRNVRRLAATAALCVLVAVVGVACGGGAGSQPSIDLVPADAGVVGVIDVSAIAADEDVASLYQRLPKEPDDPATFAELLEEVESVVGISVDDVSELAFFVAGDLLASDGSGKYGFLAAGAFDRQEVFAAIEADAEVETERTQYKGHEVLTDIDDDLAFAVIDGTFVAGSSLDTVHDVIDVAEGEAEALSGPVLDRLDAMGDAWVKLAGGPGEEASDDVLDGLADTLPVDLGTLDDYDGYGLSVGKQGQGFEAVLTVTYADPETAAEAAAVIGAIVALYAAFTVDEGDALLTGLLDLQVESDGDDMNITLALSVEQVEELLGLASGVAE